MYCWQWVIQLAGWIYSQEQDKCLMGQSLEEITNIKEKKKLEQAHPYLHLIFTAELPAIRKAIPAI